MTCESCVWYTVRRYECGGCCNWEHLCCRENGCLQVRSTTNDKYEFPPACCDHFGG